MYQSRGAQCYPRVAAPLADEVARDPLEVLDWHRQGLESQLRYETFVDTSDW